MQNKYSILAIGGAIVIVLVVVLMKFTSNSSKSMERSNTAVTVTSAPTAKPVMREGSAGSTDSAITDSTEGKQDASMITVEGANFSFTPNTITVKKGAKAKIVFKNIEGFHDFVIDELNVRTTQLKAGAEEVVEFTPTEVGQFEFYCSVGKHREMGMKGTLTVE
jgi:plastocyanin